MSAQGYTIPQPARPTTGLPDIPELGGAPRRVRYQLRPPSPWLTPPPDWLHSVAEWVVFWYLTEGRAEETGLPNLKVVSATQPPVRGETFFYQIEIPNLGLFQSEVTRVDFFLPGFGSVGYEALAIDPRNDWTHPDASLDVFKRATLGQQANIQLVWIDTARLEAGDLAVVEQALRGEDVSSLNLFGA